MRHALILDNSSSKEYLSPQLFTSLFFDEILFDTIGTLFGSMDGGRGIVFKFLSITLIYEEDCTIEGL